MARKKPADQAKSGIDPASLVAASHAAQVDEQEPDVLLASGEEFNPDAEQDDEDEDTGPAFEVAPRNQRRAANKPIETEDVVIANPQHAQAVGGKVRKTVNITSPRPIHFYRFEVYSGQTYLGVAKRATDEADAISKMVKAYNIKSPEKYQFRAEKRELVGSVGGVPAKAQ